MSPVPTGRLSRTDTGLDLILTRVFQAPVEDVWASVTDPERTARWFGPWRGEGATGGTVQVQMAFEEERPWYDLRIEVCDPPRRLAVTMTDEWGVWRVEFLLSTVDGGTELRFIQHLDTDEGLADIGPGWEYYLDMLVASRSDAPRPDFDDYHPAMKSYFAELSP